MGKSIPKRSRNTDDVAIGTIAFGLVKDFTNETIANAAASTDSLILI